MKRNELLKLCEEYDKLLEKDGFSNVTEHDEYGSLNHCRWMLNEIPNFLPEDPWKQNLEKANRWLGFVQGILWTHGYCDLKLKESVRDELEVKYPAFMMYGD